MQISRLKWPVLLCVLIVSIVGAFGWRPADATPLGQTVPTVTPTVAPITPTATFTSTPQPPSPSRSQPTPTVAAPILLPVAGDSMHRPNISGSAIAGILGLTLLALAGALWLKRPD